MDFHSRLSPPGLVHIDSKGIQQVQHEGAVRVGELAHPRLSGDEVESCIKYPVNSFVNLIDLLIEWKAWIHNGPSVLLNITYQYIIISKTPNAYRSADKTSTQSNKSYVSVSTEVQI